MVKNKKEKLIAEIKEFQIEIIKKEKEEYKRINKLLPNFSVADLKEILMELNNELYFLSKDSW